VALLDRVVVVLVLAMALVFLVAGAYGAAAFLAARVLALTIGVAARGADRPVRGRAVSALMGPLRSGDLRRVQRARVLPAWLWDPRPQSTSGCRELPSHSHGPTELRKLVDAAWSLRVLA
jgi:hypothetical protein